MTKSKKEGERNELCDSNQDDDKHRKKNVTKQRERTQILCVRQK